jgi:hypothetical protein
MATAQGVFKDSTDGLDDFSGDTPFKADLFDFVNDTTRGVNTPAIENRVNEYQKDHEGEFDRVLKDTVPARMLKVGVFGESQHAHRNGYPGSFFKDSNARVKTQSLLEDNHSLVKPERVYRLPDRGSNRVVSQLGLIVAGRTNARYSASILADPGDQNEEVFNQAKKRRMMMPSEQPIADPDEKPTTTPGAGPNRYPLSDDTDDQPPDHPYGPNHNTNHGEIQDPDWDDNNPENNDPSNSAGTGTGTGTGAAGGHHNNGNFDGGRNYDHDPGTRPSTNPTDHDDFDWTFGPNEDNNDQHHLDDERPGQDSHGEDGGGGGILDDIGNLFPWP